jgi:hypothetical protein
MSKNGVLVFAVMDARLRRGEAEVAFSDCKIKDIDLFKVVLSRTHQGSKLYLKLQDFILVFNRISIGF